MRYVFGIFWISIGEHAEVRAAHFDPRFLTGQRYGSERERQTENKDSRSAIHVCNLVGQPRSCQLISTNLLNYSNGHTVDAISCFLGNICWAPDPRRCDEKDFSTHPLTLAETHAELAGYHLWNHDLTNARQLAQKALEEDPKLGMAHEEMGFLLFDDGKDAEAEQEFSQACALDKTLYLSIFAKTMLSPAATSDTTADEAAFHAALLNVLEVNPQFAPAFVQLARLSVRQKDLKAAFALSRRAEELEPWRAGYHLLTGQILLRMGKGAAAATYAKYVADHWYGPDRDEAVELWNEIPAAQRPAGESVSEAALKNVQTVTGTVKSITCGGPGQKWTLVLNQNGRELTFHTKGFFGFGFSDTFWWGEDHFSSCRHYLGMRAIVRYQPSSDASYAGDVTEIGVRDDLPALAANATGVAAVTSRQ